MTHFFYYFFFFNDTATTEIYTLSLHDALPISRRPIPLIRCRSRRHGCGSATWSALSLTMARLIRLASLRDRKSTRLNSSHDQISYAVFCLKKKNITYEDGLFQRSSSHHYRASI